MVDVYCWYTFCYVQLQTSTIACYDDNNDLVYAPRPHDWPTRAALAQFLQDGRYNAVRIWL